MIADTAGLTYSTSTDATLRTTYLQLSVDPSYARTCGTLWARFEPKVRVVPSGCWEWSAGRNHDYGQIYHDGRPQKAHRMAWLLFRGPIPDGLKVLHRCDNPPCVNPEHLFLGTQNDNYRDMADKGRARQMPHGSDHFRARLSAARVQAIRLLIDDGVTPTAIARCLDVSIQTITAVRDGRTWTHVETAA